MVTVQPDDWLAERVGMPCYRGAAGTAGELAEVVAGVPAGAHLTVLAPLEVTDPPLPLVDVSVSVTLDRPFAPALASDRVVALGESDADELGELMRLGYRNRWDKEPAFDGKRVRTAMRDWGRGLPHRCSAVVGIRDGGRIVAFAAMRDTNPSVQLVDQVVTSTERRGKGLAREVIRHCLAIAPPQVLTAEAGISAGNDASLALFASLGFTEAGREYIYAGVVPS